MAEQWNFWSMSEHERLLELRADERRLSFILKMIELNNKGKELHPNTKLMYESSRKKLLNVKALIQSEEKTVWSK